MSKWTLDLDRETCIGSGMCTATAPDHFRFDGGTAMPVNGSVDPDDAVLDAADSCPVEAILVRDENGGVLAPQD